MKEESTTGNPPPPNPLQKAFLLQPVAMLAPNATLMLNYAKTLISLAGFKIILRLFSISYLFKLLLVLFMLNLKMHSGRNFDVTTNNVKHTERFSSDLL